MGLARFEFDSAAGTVRRLDSLAWLDSGGFGKGLALRAVRAALAAAGIRDALVNFGGQVLALGSPGSGAAGAGDRWPVGVADPRERSRPVRTLWLSGVSASTSSQSERPGHLLDPRTGRPVAAWGSVTVVARDPMVADILSTALFVMGPRDGAAWAAGRRDVGVLFVLVQDGQLQFRWNQAMNPFLEEN